MKKKLSITLSIFFCLALIILSTSLIIKMYSEKQETTTVSLPVQIHPAKQVSVTPKYYVETITLGAIGDILIHDWVYQDAKTASGYDFNPMFQHINPILQKPDILLANQETILGGEEFGISSYPLFNSPQEVGDALIQAGVDIVSTANNHSLDKGEKGLVASMNYMDKIGLPHVGTYRSPEEQQTLVILTKKGIKVAFLSYTYGTNGIPIPKGKDYLVNLIDREKMKEEIHRAKNEADVVVMSLHWGNEYQRFPTAEQKELGQYLIKEGIDILFGHHPHVLQPIEWIKAADGRDALIVYSLGNFLSGQNWDYKDIGGIATINVTKSINESGVSIKLDQPAFFPTYVSKQKLRNYRIVPLEEAGNYGLKNAAEKYLEIQQHMIGGL
ncbi:CapA family protein [Bacillus sp. DTU_2020_1000418_1_SI_GHA_SEK_038]|uniref:CapA family protein n=1 Tax=Bacillus sp. DTU_2020_1000418_1_SI_GHA_SEK_038 TaxID=3077585 RepID=UPI0028E6A472|nr:CapA family protein [Bacillus sp. DTU_2020_1000418_1_SI_GHA_SEK_038]WNS77384.1 CapA family protein [Bacillus sp. DTU_2020_1000418_1_SI_GHA_SEK_038]